MNRRAPGSRTFDPIVRAATATVDHCVYESLELRQLMAAHIVGSTTSYPTIQSAVNAAPAGATINVDPGTYDETVSIYQPLTIRGANAGVDARGTRSSESIVYATQTVFYVAANDVTIDGFTIEGSDADIGAAQGAGVLMAPSIHGTHVVNDIIQNNVTGIYLSNNSNTDQALIQHCLIQNNFEANNYWTKNPGENGSRGIYTDGTVSGGYLTNVLINANTIYNSTPTAGDEDEGIIALQALTAGKQFNITISNNYWGNDSKALLATNVTNLTIIGNYITGTVDQSSGPLRFEGDANNVDIQYNTITGNSGPGVAVDDSGAPGDNSGFVVNNNNIYGNDGIGFITQANLYDGTVYAQNDWWGDASGPGGDGPGKGQAVWANGTSGHGVIPAGLAGGYIVYSPWATSLINIANVPAPASDTGLTVTPAAAGQLTLTWTAPSSTATSQVILRSTDGVTFTPAATVSPLLNSFTDTGLTVGQTYYYEVVAVNATGYNAPTNVAAGIPPAYQPPAPASGLTATSTGPNAITVGWNVPNYPYGIAYYSVYRNGTLIGTTTTTSFADTGLAPDTAYTYAVTTTDTTGAVSAPSAATPLVSGHSQFLDNSFELTPASSSYDPATANWTFTGQSGIEYSGGGFGTIAAIPNGSQVAVIQGANGGTIGAVSQTMTVKTTGAYTISLYAEQRSGFTAQPVTVYLDGTLLGTFTPTSSTAFTQFTTAAFALYAGTHTFKFSGTKNTGDNDSYIDQVSLNLTGNASVPPAPIVTSVGAASSSSAVVTWAPGGFGATTYTVLRSNNDISWTTIASNLASTVTSYADTGLSPSTTYFYEVYATNSGIGSSGTSNVVSATTLSSAAAIAALSGLTPTTATSGFKTVQKNASVQGNTLTLHGTTYASGLGVSAASVITYSLGGTYTQFTTDVGIDAEENSAGAVLASVDFQVLGDGKVLFDTGDLGINSPTVHIAVPVAGVQVLTLVATNGVPGIAYDHADWAGATLWTNPSPPAAPTGLTALGVGTNAIGLTWAPAAASTATGYAIDRSTDGTTFTTVAKGLAAPATSWTDTTAVAGTTYYYRIRATNNAGDSGNSGVASAATLAAAPVTTPLTTLAWTSATAGYGTVQKNASIAGNTLNLHGTTYATGIGTHAASTVVYSLGGAYNVFSSDVGIDNEESGVGTGSVDFQVYGDGKLLYDSGVLTSASPTDHFAVNVTGVQTLTLVATNGVAGSISYDHADWAGAALATYLTPPAAPTGLAAVGVGTGSIVLTWAPAASAVTGYAVDRSTDGVNFTTVATGLAASATSWTDTTATSAGTTYYYRIRATNGAGASGNSVVASAATLAYAPTSVPLTTLAWTSATAGYGTVQKNASIAGNTLNLHGTTYATGIGTHAASVITYSLAGKYNVFSSDVGIDYEENSAGNGSVDFQVLGDGVLLYDSGILTGASPTDHFAVNVTGVKTLTLVATNGVAGSINYDHADWAGATLSTLTAAVAPTGFTATLSGTSVALSWAAAGSSQVRYTVQRSTDGVTFTSIAASLSTNAYTDAGPLAAGTTYVYRILATTAQGTSQPSATASVTTALAAGSVSTPLSSLTPTSATTGYGLVMTNASVGGHTITLGGVTYASGMGVHAVSNLVYNLAGQYTTFTTDVGVDDEENGVGTGSVDFQVIGDGVVLYDTGILHNGVAATHVSVSVAGVQTLTLVATNGVANDISYDHADWAGATLLATLTAPATPTNLVATAPTTTLVSLAWTAASSNVASYAVDRSTDGVTFTTVNANVAGKATSWVDPTVLTPGTTYYYRIRAVNGAGASANSAVVSVTTPAKQTATYLSDLTATSATAGYGTVQKDTSISGNPITLAGVTYAKGLGTHAASTIVYNLAGGYASFVSTVGIDDEENGKGAGQVDFQVYGDGVLLFDSGVLTNGQTANIAVSVAGVKTLTLVATNGIPNDIDYDHADWAGAQLLV